MSPTTNFDTGLLHAGMYRYGHCWREVYPGWCPGVPTGPVLHGMPGTSPPWHARDQSAMAYLGLGS